MKTKNKVILCVALASMFIAGAIASYVMLPPRYVYVTVSEAISIMPETVTIAAAYPGESGKAQFTVTNLANVDIPLNVTAEVTAYPLNGNPLDLALAFPRTLTATALTDTVLTINYTLATGTVPGDYTITVSATRT